MVHLMNCWRLNIDYLGSERLLEGCRLGIGAFSSRSPQGSHNNCCGLIFLERHKVLTIIIWERWQEEGKKEYCQTCLSLFILKGYSPAERTLPEHSSENLSQIKERMSPHPTPTASLYQLWGKKENIVNKGQCFKEMDWEYYCQRRN